MACRIIVEAEPEHGGRSRPDEPLHLSLGRIASSGDKDRFPEFLVGIPVKLVIGHGVIRALEYMDTLCILQGRTGRGGDPQAEAAVAPGGLSFVCGTSVPLQAPPFLESNDSPVPARNGKREGEVPYGHSLPARDVLFRKDETVLEGELRLQVNGPVLEVWIERPDGIHVTGFDPVEPVFLHLERLELTLRLLDHGILLLVWSIEQTAAYPVDQLVQVHAGAVLGEEMRMLLDEGDHVEGFLDRRMETAAAVLSDDELVTTDALSLLVQADKRRIPHPVLAVAHVSRVPEKIQDRESLEIIVV